MKKFISKTIIFLGILLGYFILSGGVSYYFMTNSKPNLPQENILIVGDSHTRRALDPNQFQSAVNISQPSENYILTYWKLKKIFQDYIPDTVIIGLGYQNLGAYNDLKFSNSNWSSEFFKRIYPIGDISEIEDRIPVDTKGYYSKLWRRMFAYPNPKHLTYIGGFINDSTSNLTNIDFSVQRHFNNPNIDYKVSQISVEYFDSIISICNENDVELIVVNTPAHPDYLEQVPLELREEMNDIEKRLTSNSILYFNLSTAKIPDNYYYDFHHINYRGAFYFVDSLKRVIYHK